MTSSIVFQVPLTSEEQSLYGKTFNQLDPENLGIVTGENVRSLLAASGLSPQVLSQIWSIVDMNNKGFLNLGEFSACLRMIGHLQKLPTLAVTSELYAHPLSGLPNFSGFLDTTVQRIPTSLPPVPANDAAKYSQLFDRSSNGAPLLSGDKAKDIFLKAKLDAQILGEIWGLCDRNASGSLDKVEFIMGMHLLQLALSNNPAMSSLSAEIPQSIWNSIQIGSVPTSPVSYMPLSANSTAMTSNLGRQPTLNHTSLGLFLNASSDWVLSFEKKKQFDLMFDSLDKDHDGALGSQALVPFFVSSKLNQDILASIWDLADIHNNAEFSKVEFAIAMFLIQKRNSGVELPDVIPDQLLHSPALGLYQQQLFQQPQADILSRDTNPTFNKTPQTGIQVAQNSNNGSLNDLLSLNASFSTPVAQPVVETPPITQVPNPIKKFVPTSTFGHNIIREEDEDTFQQPVKTTAMYSPSNVQQVPIPVASPQNAASGIPNMQFQQRTTAPPVPVHRAPSVSLKNVPNFGSLNIAAATIGALSGAATTTAYGMNRNIDLFADAQASAQLSTATTELANLSNQVNSLTNQAGITTEKKMKASQELASVRELKQSIETKLATLRSTHENNIVQSQQLEVSLNQVSSENEALQHELTFCEGSYQVLVSQLDELNRGLEESQQQNVQLKEQIITVNSKSASLQSGLTHKQQETKAARSLNDSSVNNLKLSEFTAVSLETELSSLTDKLAVYVTKRKELDDYQKTLEQQHEQLETKYVDLEAKTNDLMAREEQLIGHTKQIEEQEILYQQNVVSLQSMFDDLNKRKLVFEEANETLKQQHLEYAQKVQELTKKKTNIATTVSRENNEEAYAEQVSKFVEDSVANSSLGNGTSSEDIQIHNEMPIEEDEFNGDGEKDNSDNESRYTITDEIINKSTIPISINETEAKREITTESSANVHHIPGEWEAPADSTLIPVEQPAVYVTDSSDDDDDEQFQDTREEFIHSYEEEFEDSDLKQTPLPENAPVLADITPVQVACFSPVQANDKALVPEAVLVPQESTFSSPVEVVKDEFEDEFAGLEQAAVEDSGLPSYDTATIDEDFETIDHKDLDQELQENDFTTFSREGEQDISENVGNDEWEDLFTGFGNAKPLSQPSSQPVSEPSAVQHMSPPSINRAVATTPKSLAIEELSGMGFSQVEATKALEKYNWDLDAATNYLLDNA